MAFSNKVITDKMFETRNWDDVVRLSGLRSGGSGMLQVVWNGLTKAPNEEANDLWPSWDDTEGDQLRLITQATAAALELAWCDAWMNAPMNRLIEAMHDLTLDPERYLQVGETTINVAMHIVGASPLLSHGFEVTSVPTDEADGDIELLACFRDQVRDSKKTYLSHFRYVNDEHGRGIVVESRTIAAQDTGEEWRLVNSKYLNTGDHAELVAGNEKHLVEITDWSSSRRKLEVWEMGGQVWVKYGPDNWDICFHIWQYNWKCIVVEDHAERVPRTEIRSQVMERDREQMERLMDRLPRTDRRLAERRLRELGAICCSWLMNSVLNCLNDDEPVAVMKEMGPVSILSIVGRNRCAISMKMAPDRLIKAMNMIVY